MKINWRIPILVAAAVVISAALAASQGAAAGGHPWWYADVFWPNFLAFIIPVFSRWVWLRFAIVFCLPGAAGICAQMQLVGAGDAGGLSHHRSPGDANLGIPSDRNRIGLVETDALNATTKSWNAAQSDVNPSSQPGPMARGTTPAGLPLWG